MKSGGQWHRSCSKTRPKILINAKYGNYVEDCHTSAMPSLALPHRPHTANTFTRYLNGPNRAQCGRASGTTLGRLFGEVDTALLLQRMRIDRWPRIAVASFIAGSISKELMATRPPSLRTSSSGCPTGACLCRQWPDGDLLDDGDLGGGRLQQAPPLSRRERLRRLHQRNQLRHLRRSSEATAEPEPTATPEPTVRPEIQCVEFTTSPG